MQVKYLDLPRQFDNSRFFDVITAQLKKGQFILGDAVKEFETHFASLCGTTYAVGVNSGTDAMFLCLKALGIGSGDEIITVPNSFIATAAVIANAGAKIVFVDSTEDYNINVDLIEGAITSRTKAIIPVHLTGNPAKMDRIMEITKKYGLHVIEDASQAIGAALYGRPVGSFGIAGCFSLHPLKNLNVCGDGGVITTSSVELYDKLVLLRNHGLIDRNKVAFFGYNSRLDSIQAAIASEVLKDLDEIIKKRQRNAEYYDKAFSKLNDFIVLPPKNKNAKHVYHTYVIMVKERDKLSDFLAENGIESKIHYPIPIHLQIPGKEYGFSEGDFSVTEKQAKTIITLPIHQYLTTKELDCVIEIVSKFYKSAPCSVKKT